MANKKNILQTSTCESNMGKLMELIEISAKVQGQLFNCLKVSDEGFMFNNSIYYTMIYIVEHCIKSRVTYVYGIKKKQNITFLLHLKHKVLVFIRMRF